MIYSNRNSAPFGAEWDTQFKGLYLSLPFRCFSSNGRYLLLRSKSSSRIVVHIYDFLEHKIHPLDSPLGANTSVLGLAIFDHYVTVNIVDCVTPYRLYAFDLHALDRNINGWYSIAEYQFKNEVKHPIQWKLDRFFPDNESLPVESIYVHTQDSESKQPLIVWIHGGPNASISCK